MEIPLYDGQRWRWYLCTALFDLLSFVGFTHLKYGIFYWQSCKKKSCLGLSKIRAEGNKMAYPRHHCIDRKLSLDDVLYHSVWLDATLFLFDYHRKI